MSSIQLKIVKTDVTCVKFYHNYILTAVGNTIQLFTSAGQLLQISKIFNGQKIHGIVPNSTNKIALFGGNQLKIYEFDFLQTRITNELVHRQCEDWIFALQWVDSDMSVATIFAHNFISLWNVSNLSLAKRVGCKQKCILYSAALINDTWSNLHVFSGTVFGQILIWNPSSANCNFADVLYRLEGHDGAIFSIDYSPSWRCIVTTSDDRTVRLWYTSRNIFSVNSANSTSNIMLKHTLYGHTARIFKCKIMDDLIVTAGEDSFVHVWNLDGKLVRKFETHQGGSVWALDASSAVRHDLIMTGGGDAGVSLYPKLLQNNVKTIDFGGDEIPKIFKLTALGNIVIIMNDGSLQYYIKDSRKLEYVEEYKDLKSYAILELSPNKEIIILAGFNGAIYIYKELSDEILEFVCERKPDGNRIFAIHWLTHSIFLTSTVDGLMHCWSLEGKQLIKKNYEFILPHCKERWATCAALYGSKNLVVGDRKGNIHLYELNRNESIQTIKKAHCHLGVTGLCYINDQLYSLGRNGILNKYYLNTSQRNSSLRQVASDKLPFSWIATLKMHKETTYICGFSGSNFILYNLDHRRIILEVNCGGGHRSWDCLVTRLNLLCFYFIKDKQLNVCSAKWCDIFKPNLIDGFHTKEINCGAMLQVNDKYLVLTGGEDTTIRLSLVDECKFNTFQTVKAHLSSVRCITYCSLNKTINKQEFFVFSGGGRAQIIFQKININLSNNKIDCQQLYSYYKAISDEESETRIMDLITISLEKYVLLIAGCSDGTLKCFKVSKQNFTFDYLTEIKYKCKCIIRLSYIHISNNHIIISMATDGKLVFWNFNDICSTIDTETIQSDLTPFFELKTHQSGINSFDYRKITDKKYLFVSGGDDNSINLNAIDFNFDNTQLINVCSQLKMSDVHAAQVTGLYLNEKFLISTSIDQNISFFKYDLNENVLTCNIFNQYNSSISDIQGMKCISQGNTILVCVFGKGIEICNIVDLPGSQPKYTFVPYVYLSNPNHSCYKSTN